MTRAAILSRWRRAHRPKSRSSAGGGWGGAPPPLGAIGGAPPPPSAVRREGRGGLARISRARAAGATIEIGAAAVRAIQNGRAVGVILEGARPRAADLVLVAAGPWSPFLLDPSGDWRPIGGTWGATAQIELEAPPRHVVEE